MKLVRLNTLRPEWSQFSDDYVVCDDGHIYRIGGGQLREGYYRDKKYGYRQVRSGFGAGTGKQYTIKVHRAVALAFVPNPDNLPDIDHINNDKTDNRADNLQWLSHRDNLLKAIRDRRKICVTIFELIEEEN